MNFLAHLQLADRAGLPLSGAILGDVVRGRLDGRFPEPLERSLALHRRIDVATDRHAVVRAAREQFPDGARRYAGILLDVLWDHCLASDWPSDEPLEAFAARAAQAITAGEDWRLATGEAAPPAERFERLLLSYRDEAGIDSAFERIATRLAKPQPMLAAAEGWRTRLPALREVFPALYADLGALGS